MDPCSPTRIRSPPRPPCPPHSYRRHGLATSSRRRPLKRVVHRASDKCATSKPRITSCLAVVTYYTGYPLSPRFRIPYPRPVPRPCSVPLVKFCRSTLLTYCCSRESRSWRGKAFIILSRIVLLVRLDAPSAAAGTPPLLATAPSRAAPRPPPCPSPLATCLVHPGGRVALQALLARHLG